MAVPCVLLPSDNLADGVTPTLSTGSADASYPVTNVTDGDVTTPFKASAGGDVRIVFSLGSAQRVDGVFVPMSNIPAGLSGLKWQGHTSDSWSSPDVSVDLTMPAYFSLGPDLDAVPESLGKDFRSLYSVAGRTKAFWSLLIPGYGDSPETIAAIGEILFGPLTDVWGFSPDDNLSEDSTFEIVKQALGRRWALRYPLLQRRLAGTVIVDGSEEDSFVQVYREVGTADPFIWMNDPENDDVGLLMHFEKPIPRQQLAPSTDASESVHRIRVDLIETVRGLPL